MFPATRLLTEAAAAAGAVGTHEVEAVDTLFFFVVVLLIGVFTQHVLCRYTGVPYTAWLLVRHPPFTLRCTHCHPSTPCVEGVAGRDITGEQGADDSYLCVFLHSPTSALSSTTPHKSGLGHRPRRRRRNVCRGRPPDRPRHPCVGSDPARPSASWLPPHPPLRRRVRPRVARRAPPTAVRPAAGRARRPRRRRRDRCARQVYVSARLVLAPVRPVWRHVFGYGPCGCSGRAESIRPVQAVAHPGRSRSPPQRRHRLRPFLRAALLCRGRRRPHGRRHRRHLFAAGAGRRGGGVVDRVSLHFVAALHVQRT